MKFLKFIFLSSVFQTINVIAAADSDSFLESFNNGHSLSSIKLRHEYVDQDGKSKNANALTSQTFLGWKTAPYHGFVFGLQGIAVSPIIDNYNSIKKGIPDSSKLDYPVVADPEDYNINQAFMSYSINKDTSITLGRQRIFLDNYRFIGDVRFRQNYQVMDGVSLNIKPIKNVDLFLGHMENVRQITTKNQKANIQLFNLKYSFSDKESLTTYGYLIDWKQASQKSKSDQTYGLRLVGQRPVNDTWDWFYNIEYADQQDYKDGSESIDNYYYRLSLGAGQSKWSIHYDQEKLSGNSDGKSFQTNLGTNHLFQGWADQFLVTPNEGIVDHIISAKAKFNKFTYKAEFHWIYSDRDFSQANGSKGDFYGHEFDLGIYYSFNEKIKGSLEYANFEEGDVRSTSRKRDTEKIWLTFIYDF